MIELSDLLSRIEKNKQKKEVVFNSFDFFLKSYNIENGLDKVPTYLIYYLYRKFLSSNLEILPIKKRQFFKQFKQLFKLKRYGKQRYYLLDKKVLKFTEDDLINSRIYEKKKKV